MQVKAYRREMQQDWDALVASAKNSSFLFYRGFMEYHADRFEDASVLVYDEKEQLLALLPANRKGHTVYSHQGLSYGGLVLAEDCKLKPALAAWQAILEFYREFGVDEVVYKALPTIYHRLPADEIAWGLTLMGAELFRRDASLSIAQEAPLAYQNRRKRSIKKAQKAGYRFEEGSAPELLRAYWEQILVPNMEAKHGLKPVHSLAEICLLAERFPDNIRQWNVYNDEGQIMAGATMFLNPQVAHAQYISGSAEGRREGYLDLLFHHLISEAYADYPYFDFGNSNEDQGRKVNEGLLDWKEGFGGRALVHDFYRLKTNQADALSDYLV